MTTKVRRARRGGVGRTTSRRGDTSHIYNTVIMIGMDKPCKYCKTKHTTNEEMDKCLEILKHLANSNLELYGYKSLRD